MDLLIACAIVLVSSMQGLVVWTLPAPAHALIARCHAHIGELLCHRIMQLRCPAIGYYSARTNGCAVSLCD